MLSLFLIIIDFHRTCYVYCDELQITPSAHQRRPYKMQTRACIIRAHLLLLFPSSNCATNEQNKLGSCIKTPKSVKHQSRAAVGVFPLIRVSRTHVLTVGQNYPRHTMKSHARPTEKNWQICQRADRALLPCLPAASAIGFGKKAN